MYTFFAGKICESTLLCSLGWNNTHFFLFLGLKDLRFCTRLLDEINYSCDGSSVVQNEAGEVFGLEKVALDHVESVTVEHENQVQVSINKVMSYLKHVFPAARKVALTNCIACEVNRLRDCI